MTTNDELFARAARVIPGGVNSPVRAFKAVGGTPVFIERGVGAFVFDVDGNRYLDFVGSWGPLILGHADPDVLVAIIHTASSGTTFGAPTAREVEFGELVRFMMPSMEKMRLVSSGTEATMSALRVARGFTGRRRIIKIDGDYTQENGGVLEIEVGGLEPGTQHDQLQATGFAALAGRLEVPITATRISLGEVSFSNSKRFPLISGASVDSPVTFPPGRARLLAKPLPTGSSSNVITMGIVEVASLAERVAVGPLVTMASTLSRTSSAASPGS